MNIGIITIAYDGYGKFIEEWFESILNQTMKPKEVVIVLSRNHDFCVIKQETIIKKGNRAKIKVKIVNIPERLSIGRLRNEGIAELKTDWILYFSADDILLNNAIEEISYVASEDVVAMKFYKDYRGTKEIKETVIPRFDNLNEWIRFYKESGYIAFKRNLWEQAPYEHSDYPNFPFMFKTILLKAGWTKTENPCAIYMKRKDGHGSRRTTKQQNRAVETVNNAALTYYNMSEK